MIQTVKNIFSILLNKERKTLLWLTVLDILVSLLDIIFIAGLLGIISLYTGDGHTGYKTADDLLARYPLLPAGLFLLLFACKNFLGFTVSRLQYNFVFGVASRISADNLRGYLNGSYEDYIAVDSSVNSRKISQQPIEFAHYILSGMQQVFSQFVLIGIAVTAVIIFSPVLFLLLSLTLLPPVLLLAWLFKKKMNGMQAYGKAASEKTMQHLQEALAGYVESNVYGRHDFFSKRYNNFQSRLNHYLAERLVIQSLPSRLIEVFAVFGLFMMIVLQNWMQGPQQLKLVTIGAFVAAAYKVIPGIVRIINYRNQVKTYSFVLPDLLGSKAIKKQRHSKQAIRSVAFNKVYFDYPGKNVLSNFSMQLSAGDMVGISGSSGKGKTTIANLLLGFLEPVSGNILINEKHAGKQERQAYWNRIAYIKQQPFFVHDSLVQNITFHETEHDSSKVFDVVEKTGMQKLVDTKPAGIHTTVKENGKNFSGGQRQRIVFARALYKDADLLVLDEPFNELDDISEIKMLNQLRELASEGKIIILITHNRNTLSFCNKKIILDEQ
ncbi:MAG: ABC transporter ATP-binding protein [Ferruginibacter sp.]